MATIATEVRVEKPPVTATGIRIPAISLETALYLILFAAAAFTRLYDLGSGALHHDESMHAYYSWRFLEGNGYAHNPLLHGPLLFVLTALGFFFFPENDATARLMPAIFGIALVMLPWLLRNPRYLGRWGALSASTFLLISPSIFYYSRHLRHDMFTVALTLLLFICMVRFLDEHRRVWIITGAASLALLLANHEIIFAIIALLFGYLYVAFVGPPDAYVMRGLHIAFALALTFLVLPGWNGRAERPGVVDLALLVVAVRELSTDGSCALAA